MKISEKWSFKGKVWIGTNWSIEMVWKNVNDNKVGGQTYENKGVCWKCII